ncbi:tetratricopeptide repeat protein [Actinomadura macrotermitis]|uniref:DUF4034 domain-containing protein n=1 Tax=Actinomadura macrotermitis TaxID=2585200 RepID=A0A7K0C4J0_9ACTN|nr:hypothetical protein [Actinomadura macrotermitis]MQY08328.1 hypothetical protein [Actinomadura macrotermitis]
MEHDRIGGPAGSRPRTAQVIGGRPWADPVLDQAVSAVHDHRFRLGAHILGGARADPETRSLRVEALAKAAVGRSHGIETLLAEDPGNPDLWLWLGRARVEEAWAIRPDARARAVQATGYTAYTRRMQTAREPLMRAAELRPDDPVPWEAMLWLALGLDLDREDKDALWRQASRRGPALYGAHVARVVSLSPQWGGVPEEMFDFVRLALSTADRRDPRAALLPLAYFEYFVQERSGVIRGASSWFAPGEIRDVAEAARGWFEGPRPHPRTIEAHNLFGAAFHLADARRPARQHLLRTFGRPSGLPWTYLGGDGVGQYLKACRHLNVVAA